MGLITLISIAVMLTHEAQICQAVLAMCVVVGVTLALSTATSTWSPGTALLQATNASASATAAAAAPATAAAAAPATAAADQEVCHQHRHGVGGSGGPRGVVPARAQLRALPQSGMQAAHERRLDPNSVRMPIAVIWDTFSIMHVALGAFPKQACSLVAQMSMLYPNAVHHHDNLFAVYAAVMQQQQSV